MASATKHHIEIQQGATFILDVAYQDSSGTPINIAGATIKMEVRESYTAASALLSLSGTITDAAAGEFRIEADESVTAALTAPATGVYDVELTLSGNVYRLLEGKAIITPEATKV